MEKGKDIKESGKRKEEIQNNERGRMEEGKDIKESRKKNEEIQNNERGRMEEGKHIKEGRKKKEEIQNNDRKDGRGQRHKNLNNYKLNHRCTYNNIIQHKHQT